MAGRYHLKSDGTPGRCVARTLEACRATGYTLDFHGTLEEVQAESERRLSATHGEVAPAVSKTASAPSKEDRKNWTARALELDTQRQKAIDRGPGAFEPGRLESIDRADKVLKSGLGELHGIDGSKVREEGLGYLVTGADGSNHYYGLKGMGRRAKLEYKGRLHPELEGTTRPSSEHTEVIDGRKATEHESRSANVEYYGYATAYLKGHGDVTFATDPQGYPSKVPAWNFIDSSKLPQEIFEDEKLREALANRGVLKD